MGNSVFSPLSVSGEETGLRISNYGRRVVICSLAAVAPPADRETVLPVLDRYAELMA